MLNSYTHNHTRQPHSKILLISLIRDIYSVIISWESPLERWMAEYLQVYHSLPKVFQGIIMLQEVKRFLGEMVRY